MTTVSIEHTFVALCIDYAEKSALRAETRPSHLAWVSAVDSPIFFGGPLKHAEASGPHGSFLLLKSTSVQDATDFLAEDPYAKVELFQEVKVCEFEITSDRKSPLPSTLYVIWSMDQPESKELRNELTEAHSVWWDESTCAGFIGNLKNDAQQVIGQLIVSEGENVQQVQLWTSKDPFSKNELFENTYVSSLKKVMEDSQMVKL